MRMNDSNDSNFNFGWRDVLAMYRDRACREYSFIIELANTVSRDGDEHHKA